MRPPAAPRGQHGQLGDGLHRAHRRGLPAAAAHAGRPATPGDPGTQREPADQGRAEGAHRRPEGTALL